jgi:peroxiredoxin family protein/rhodanese-related sulfurtransferase/TusA-related sulfurtransferase
MTVDDLTEIEHAYAPPYSSAKDPVNMAGFVAQNTLDGLVNTITWDELQPLDPAAHCLLDVRTRDEFATGTIPGAINIPLDELRGRIGELPAGQPITIFCRVGQRGYLAARILMAAGRGDCANLSGGYLTWRQAVAPDTTEPHVTDENFGESPMATPTHPTVKFFQVDACGLQCPGPIMRLKQEMDRLAAGDVLTITASDPGFASDAPAWARATGHTVREITSSKGLVTAVIEKGGGTPGPAGAGGNDKTIVVFSGGNDKTIVVFSGDLDKVIASFVIANGALAMGRKVTMFFTFWGLNALRRPEAVPGMGKSLIEAAFGWMMPRGSQQLELSRMQMGGIGARLIRGIMRNKQVPSLEEMMAIAIRNGATLVACQMSMELMGIRREELLDGIQIGGVAAYLEASEHADNNLFI